MDIRVAREFRKKKIKKMRVASAGVFPERISVRWVKVLVALFLLPLAWVLTRAFLDVFAPATWRGIMGFSLETIAFGLGVALWGVIFFALPRPLWLYVFGHELTHALWVIISMGRVHEFRVTREGGHILTDKTNTLIALAPYFFPIYSILFIAVYGYAIVFWKDLADCSWAPHILYAGIGFTWSFHLTFTCWMIPKGQADLEYGGHFFSLLVIYIVNLLCLAVLLMLVLPSATFTGFAHSLLTHSVNFVEWVVWVVSLGRKCFI